MKTASIGLTIAIAVVLSGLLGIPFQIGSEFRSPLTLPLTIVLAFIAVRAMGGHRAFAALFALSSIAASYWFAGRLHGEFIFSDDHPTFLYRLMQLQDMFPSIPFYNVEWNGGVEAREFFASGILSVYFLFSPILALTTPIESYTTIVALLLFVVSPAAFMAATALSGQSRITTYLTGTVALLGNILWYRWGLTFGTLGFVTSVTFLPLAVVLIERSLREAASVRMIGLLIVVVSLVLFWPLGVIMLAPAMIFTIARWRCWITNHPLLVAGGLLAAIHLPWMLLFAEVSGVLNFLFIDSTPQTAAVTHTKAAAKIVTETWETLGKRLGESFRATHPLVLGCGIIGSVVFPIRLIGFTALWLAVLGIVGPFYAPQLELDRFVVASTMILSIPAASLAARFFDAPRRVIGQLGVLALIMLGFFGLRDVLRNHTIVRWYEAQPIVRDLSTAIRDHGGNGRVLFAGFILHELSEGHVAPLVRFSGKPIMASRYQHDRWQYEDIMPEQFRSRKDAGVDEFLSLYNVSAVVTHDRFWRKWFKQRPDRYQVVWNGGRFHIFRRIRFEDSYVFRGDAEVDPSHKDKIVVVPKSEEVVLKFNYIPSLSTSGCTIEPVTVSPPIRFIRLYGCTVGSPVTVQAQRPWERLVGASR